ncbi:pyruvate dehydrogenase complex E1 component subunit beta [Wolbachia endosymbiont of Howardula sp.]|uniref:pyruvate dehydrogenase complex E1 component subunit beta n=1 Tax=Wolbachia endosymbiont of Howardula sp. TaxID=2916816 RepID=UPI00217E8686|nr:pyruvate dehydrogenase complex E1 component subunit beta [Wolbachia endosymbiont of Howardula sp.]UWI83426.1 pyruvate dehydrogenase complex E1 component subunit beta [Wolbachia endosymbiont of Howardula sp.]
MAFLSVREALCIALREEMQNDPNIFIIGQEIGEYNGAYKVTKGLLKEFGCDRIIDSPITEHGLTGLAIGASFAGLKPIVEFMTFNFSMQAIDQIVNSAAKIHYMSGGQLGCSIVFRGPNGASSRVAAQHSQCFASWYAHIPGLKVIAPYFASDCRGLLKSAIRDPNPVIFLENEIAYSHEHEVPESQMRNKDFLIDIGKASVIRKGKDVTITAFSLKISHTLHAADLLYQNDGIDAEVIDLRTLRPLDSDTIINSLKKTNRLVSVEDGWPFAGIGTEISTIAMEQGFDYLDAPVIRVTGQDIPLPYASNLEKKALPQVEDIISAVHHIVNHNNQFSL